jgi:hypothetical protein
VPVTAILRRYACRGGATLGGDGRRLERADSGEPFPTKVAYKAAYARRARGVVRSVDSRVGTERIWFTTASESISRDPRPMSLGREPR